ncbi:hypothetical protein ACL6C3_14110 [Capilliphycus salinus ALCB114379]|uniref:hypothetical protein n=1 Tax=Capilliphycus salinus TaxID=2768948 RepID=UPI0039A6D21C
MNLYQLILAKVIAFSLISVSFSTIFQAEVLSETSWMFLSGSQPKDEEGFERESLWRRFFPRSEPPPEEGSEGGSKGDDFCPIAPNQFSEVERVWNERPTFTWTGVLTKVEIREQGNEKVVWSQEISAENQIELNTETESSTPLKLYQVTLGTVLKPGQVYELQVSTSPPIDYRPISLRIMTPEERNSITQDLQKLEEELEDKNITGDGAILQRADYFASQKLWSEFWQEVLSVESPSEDLKGLINETVKELCLPS